jgi:drug/metabolite transporter (DMT)-like permease
MQSQAARLAIWPVSALLLNALLWGVSWWPLRELQQHGLHPLWSTAIIFMVATAGILLINFKSWRGFVLQPQLWLLALASGLTNVGFNWAVTVGDVLRVVLLFYLMPAWAVLVAWVMLGEKPSIASLLRLLLAMTGVMIVLKTPDSAWPVPNSAADWLAVLGGFSFAVTNALLRKFSDSSSGSRMLAMFGGGAVMASAAALLGMSQQVVSSPALSAGNGLVALALLLSLSLAFMGGNAALQYGAARLAGSTTALVMLTEILFASLSAAALDAADLSWRVLLGGSLIVLAAVLAAVQ